jgi:Tol biopolymer transport system component
MKPEKFAPGIITTDIGETFPAFVPDEKYLFFSSQRRGNEDIYWVFSEIIDKLRPDKF